jgi:CDP-ribitol ribitolphosphotransferase
MGSDNLVLFLSRQADEPSLDIKLLSGELERRGAKIKILCKFVDAKVSSLIKYFPHFLRQLFWIRRAKIIVLDSYCIPISMFGHRKDKTVVQMWHASGLMKWAGYSALGKDEGRGGLVAKIFKMHRGYDFIVASSEACIHEIFKVFGYDENGRWKESGAEAIIAPLPRFDYIAAGSCDEDAKKNILKKYPRLKTKKNILYAPTFRKNETEFEPKAAELIDAVDFGDYNLIIKKHPLSKIALARKASGRPSEAAPDALCNGDLGRVQNEGLIFADEFGTTDLIALSDIFISDYSSVIYEFLATGKPVYFYAFDIKKYRDARGFCFDYENEIPGRLHDGAKELIADINMGGADLKRQQAFFSKYVDMKMPPLAKAITRFL